MATIGALRCTPPATRGTRRHRKRTRHRPLPPTSIRNRHGWRRWRRSAHEAPGPRMDPSSDGPKGVDGDVGPASNSPADWIGSGGCQRWRRAAADLPPNPDTGRCRRRIRRRPLRPAVPSALRIRCQADDRRVERATPHRPVIVGVPEGDHTAVTRNLPVPETFGEHCDPTTGHATHDPPSIREKEHRRRRTARHRRRPAIRPRLHDRDGNDERRSG